jgi:hypothetical protein
MVPKRTIFEVFLASGKLSSHHLMKSSSRKVMKSEYIMPTRKIIV